MYLYFYMLIYSIYFESIFLLRILFKFSCCLKKHDILYRIPPSPLKVDRQNKMVDKYNLFYVSQVLLYCIFLFIFDRQF